MRKRLLHQGVEEHHHRGGIHVLLEGRGLDGPLRGGGLDAGVLAGGVLELAGAEVPVDGQEDVPRGGQPRPDPAFAGGGDHVTGLHVQRVVEGDDQRPRVLRVPADGDDEIGAQQVRPELGTYLRGDVGVKERHRGDVVDFRQGLDDPLLRNGPLVQQELPGGVARPAFGGHPVGLLPGQNPFFHQVVKELFVQ